MAMHQTWVISIAALIAVATQYWTSPKRFTFRGGKYPYSSHLTSHIKVSDSEKELYRRDGFFLKKGFLKGDEVDELLRSSDKIKTPRPGLGNYYQNFKFDMWRKTEAFAQLAFETLPVVAAEVLGYNDNTPGTQIPTNQSLRILKDSLFALSRKGNGCGFHVDDDLTWPATDDSTGVTIWITFSPLRVTEGGGLRLVNKSLIEESVLKQCREVIREGSTCLMETLSPECHTKMLNSSAVFDLEPGDAIIFDRWTFHASEPFHTEHPEGQEGNEKLRYSIRYVPATAKPSGIYFNTEKAGEVFSSAFYPKAWPSAERSEIDSIQYMYLEFKEKFASNFMKDLMRLYPSL